MIIGKELLTLKVPHWGEILKMASASYDMTKLGYLGADVVLDKTLGPMLLKLNARPSLAIQISNAMGIRNRFDMVDKVIDKYTKLEEKIQFSLENFK